ncbi:MAG: hypothetical protein GY925_24870, partial [Actinomycetia bacterium]|nr:hypothetical protein [Actinomycetes bacterium]
MTEAGVAYVSLVPSMRNFGSAVSQGMSGQLDGPMDEEGRKQGRHFMAGFGDAMTRQGRNISGLGDKMTLGLTIPLAIAANKMTGLASDTAENLSKVQTIFGSASGDIEAF